MSLFRTASVRNFLWLLSAMACLAPLAACAAASTQVPNSTPSASAKHSIVAQPSPAATTPAAEEAASAPTAILQAPKRGTKAPGGVVVTEILSVRAGPGYQYRKVGELLKGAEFDIMARWCAYHPDEDWYLIGIRGDEQRWIPAGRQYVSTWLADDLVCLVPPPTPTATPVDPHFRVDRTVIAPGECVQLEWDAEQIQALYLDGEPVARRGVKRTCPAQTWTYVLTVVERDGRRHDHELTVEIRGSPASTAESERSVVSTPTPVAAATSTPAFPQVITDPSAWIEFQLAIGRFRLAEKAALRSPDSDAAEQLKDFASDEALEAALERVRQLRRQGLAAELSIPQMDVRIAVLQDEHTAGVLVQERRILRTYRSTSDGNVLVDEEVFNGTMVYGLIYLDSQWKVERMRSTSADNR